MTVGDGRESNYDGWRRLADDAIDCTADTEDVYGDGEDCYQSSSERATKTLLQYGSYCHHIIIKVVHHSPDVCSAVSVAIVASRLRAKLQQSSSVGTASLSPPVQLASSVVVALGPKQPRHATSPEDLACRRTPARDVRHPVALPPVVGEFVLAPPINPKVHFHVPCLDPTSLRLDCCPNEVTSENLTILYYKVKKKNKFDGQETHTIDDRRGGYEMANRC